MKLKLEHIFNWNNVFATLIVIGILKYLPVLFNIDMLDPIQNTFEDMQITDIVFSQVRDYEDIKIDKNIVLVNNGHLDRKTTAEMIEILNNLDPKIIAIDAFFRSPKGPEQDEPLAEAFSNVENLILVNELYDSDEDTEFDSLKTSNPMFNRYAKNGYANMYIDPNDFKTVRLIKPISKVKDKYIPSLSSKVTQIYDNEKYQRYKSRENELEVINFKRNIDKYNTYNYDVILNGDFDPDHFKGKIVLIGYLGPQLGEVSTEDIFYTPMNKNYVGKTEPDMYGVVIHANVISMILEEDYIYRTSDTLALILMLLVVYFNMIMFNYWRRSDDLVMWYQPYTIILILSELIGFSLLMIFLMHWFKIELRFAAAFFAILVTVLSFELFTDSLRPLVVGIFRRRELKKNMEEAKNNEEFNNEIESKDENKNLEDSQNENINEENVENDDEIKKEEIINKEKTNLNIESNLNSEEGEKDA